MSTLNVDKVDPSTGTALELGTSGDTITVPTGAGLTVVDEVKTNKISPATGTAFALGDSGDTFTVPSGATIVNSGTATGFGGGKLLQVVNSENGYRVLISTTTLTDMDSADGVTWEVAITPSSSSSKVLFTCNLSLTGAYTAGADAKVSVCLFEKIGAGSYTAFGGAANSTSNISANHAGLNKTAGDEISLGNVFTQSILRTTNTTSAVSYKIQWKCNNSSASSYNNDEVGSQITLMEIGA